MQQNLLYNENFSLKLKLDQELQHLEHIPHGEVDEVSNIDPLVFRSKYVEAQRPLIIRNGAKEWAATQNWNFDFFKTNYGDVEVVANLYDVKNKQKVNFRQLVGLLASEEYEVPTYLQEWWFQENCGELLNDIVVPDYFADDCNKALLGFHNNTLWIGQKGAFTPIHQDTTFANVWSAQIMGKKEWILIDKKAQILPDKGGAPDYANFFAESKNQILRARLEKGDILYMPHKWWHRASTLEHSISLNTFYITADIVQKYLTDVLRIPFAALLNKELLQTYDPMRYNICMQRSAVLTKMLGLNPQNILGIDTSGQSVGGIYSKQGAA